MKSIGESLGQLFGAELPSDGDKNINIAGNKRADTSKPKRTPKENYEIIERKIAEAAARKAANAGQENAEPTVPALPVLSPIRHPQIDFFIADILDASLKGDMASMEHPLFALKAGDKRIRKYERNGNSVIIKPGSDGCATIHDKDIWIYCISQIIEAMNRGRDDISKTVRFTAHDFLVTTNRQISGQGYKLMGDALARLRGTSIETNIATNGQRERGFFGLIDSGRVVESDKTGRAVAVEVTLPEWLYRSIQAKNVLTLSPNYFRIRKPIDRRIYELARKHCGAQKSWQCTVKTLHEKSGSTDAVRNFKGVVKALADSGELPDYQVSLVADLVTFTRR